MNTEAIVAKLEDRLASQARLVTDDPNVERTMEALLDTLGPALRQAVMDLAEQAAIEVGAQLTGAKVEVVLADGEPSLVVRHEGPEATFSSEDLAARLTVRLPSALKAAVEEAAGDEGDSINSFVIKALAGGATRTRRGRRIRETLQT